MPLEDVLKEVALRFLESAAKRCAKRSGKEIVMNKYFCDGCGNELAVVGSTLDGKAKIGGKEHTVQIMMFLDPDENDVGTCPDLCVSCWERITAEVFKQNAKKK